MPRFSGPIMGEYLANQTEGHPQAGTPPKSQASLSILSFGGI
jgi:hypothetical protein